MRTAKLRPSCASRPTQLAMFLPLPAKSGGEGEGHHHCWRTVRTSVRVGGDVVVVVSRRRQRKKVLLDVVFRWATLWAGQ